MLNFITKIIGSKNERELKRARPLLRRVNELEEEISRLTDAELRAKTDEFKRRIAEASASEREALEKLRALEREQGLEPTPENDDRELTSELESANKTLRAVEADILNEILPEAFAVVREASKRTTGLRHYDVQLLGGVFLHRGSIAEMKTGEGKTLVATLALYLNALTGRGVHLVTVNDYLARRDVQWMGPIYHMLGLSVASIVHETSFVFDPTYVVRDYRMLNLRPVERRDAYRADITYGTNHEFGFDYLRDNMKFALEEYVQREPNYAIVDEVDNILIDEARTPLIISGPAEDSTDKYYAINRIVPRLRRGERTERKGDQPAEESGDYWVDEKSRSAILTEAGVAKVERMLGVPNLYDPAHIDTLHHVNQAVKAHAIFKRDVDYIVKDGQVIIVDEFTGRLMPGRRWSDGLHQAVEAKEAVRIERENQTLATITIQNYFRMYDKLAGMTGTADTESVEFKNIYKLDVVVIPPNRPLVRIDHADVVYKTEREKFNAAADEIAECHEKGQPVLVGTISVEKSEQLSKMLKRRGIKHNVLNAVNHEAEANVIAQAGRYGAVTIATNMAGRGTDILLGGNPDFLARADMEHEWIKRSASLPDGAQRYEDVLQKLRDQYDEAVQQAQREYESKWKPHEEAQARTLDELTEAHRTYLEAAYWKTRGDYEKHLAELRAGSREAATARLCREAAAAYSEALQQFDQETGPYFGEEGQQRFVRTLQELSDALVEVAGSGAGNPNRLPTAMQAFERARVDYERSVERGLRADASLDCEEAKRNREESERQFREAEAAYLKQRKPYEEAVAKAQDRYEEERRKYTTVVEDLREEMEKAPAEFGDRREEILETYEGTCREAREKVLAAGGLHIMGTERHESRRIDNQLRGRSGRQGDPGSSRFYLSLEDDLLRIFGAERIQGLMTRLGMEEGEPIEHRLISRAVANAQSKVEGRNFDIRKHLLEYDDVMNQQREIVYGRRRGILGRSNLRNDILEMVGNVAAVTVDRYANHELAPQDWDWEALDDGLKKTFGVRMNLKDDESINSPQVLEQAIVDRARAVYDEKEESFTPPVLRQLEKLVMLQTLDALWKDHLLGMDHLKEGVGLRGYGQKNPLQEYKREGFEMFEAMMGQLEADVVEKVFAVQVARQEDVEMMQERRRARQPSQLVMSGGAAAGPASRPAAARREGAKVGRNDPCPCGSGKKYKKCHGA